MHARIDTDAQQQLAKEIDEFLAKGGKIQKLPYMPDLNKKNSSKNTFQKHAERLETARKKAMASASWRKQSVAGYPARQGKK